MDRRAALIFAASLSALALAASVALAKKAETKKSEKKKPGHTIHLRSIDLARRYALIELSGFGKPPGPNLFTFTDERKRHYVAMGITCDPPFPSGTRACELAIPQGYERHRLVKLELHVGGLHSRTIEVPSGEIASAWEAAMAAKVEPPKEIMPSPSPSPRPLTKPAPNPSPQPKKR